MLGLVPLVLHALYTLHISIPVMSEHSVLTYSVFWRVRLASPFACRNIKEVRPQAKFSKVGLDDNIQNTLN
jgi:hypothetical protein